MTMVRAGAALGLIVLLAACSPGSDDGSTIRQDPSIPPAESPYVIGTVTHLDGNEIRIEEVPADSAGSDKVVARIVPATRIYGLGGERVTPTALRVGQQVQAWLTGPVMESYPVRGTADRLVIVKDSTGG